MAKPVGQVHHSFDASTSTVTVRVLWACRDPGNGVNDPEHVVAALQGNANLEPKQGSPAQQTEVEPGREAVLAWDTGMPPALQWHTALRVKVGAPSYVPG